MYQRKLDELQARLRELESAHKNSEGKKQEKKEEQVPQTPKVPYFFCFLHFYTYIRICVPLLSWLIVSQVCVLVDQSVAQERVDEAVGYLQEKADVKKEEIQIVDASKDFELIGVVKVLPAGSSAREARETHLPPGTARKDRVPDGPDPGLGHRHSRGAEGLRREGNAARHPCRREARHRCQCWVSSALCFFFFDVLLFAEER